MNTYSVKTRFIFEGEFKIFAKSKNEARKSVDEYCGMVSIGGIHTNCNEKVCDWLFPVHPEKEIVSITVSNINNYSI